MIGNWVGIANILMNLLVLIWQKGLSWTVKRKATYMTNFSHSIYSALRNAYGLAAFHRKGGKGKWGQTVEDCSDNNE